MRIEGPLAICTTQVRDQGKCWREKYPIEVVQGEIARSRRLRCQFCSRDRKRP